MGKGEQLGGLTIALIVVGAVGIPLGLSVLPFVAGPEWFADGGLFGKPVRWEVEEQGAFAWNGREMNFVTDLIWRETQLAKQSKPVIISMSDVAASGGYYVAAGATKIVAQPGTVTGSIGVVAGKLVTAGLYDLLGLSRETIQLNPHSSFYYTGARYSDDEKAIYWKLMNKIYEQFTTHVANGRGMTTQAVDKIGQGHVWTGARAKELGLIDELGGFSRAIAVAKQEAGIPESRQVRLVYLPEKPSMWSQLFGGEEDEASVRFTLPPELARSLQQVGRMTLLSRERAVLLEPELAGAP